MQLSNWFVFLKYIFAACKMFEASVLFSSCIFLFCFCLHQNGFGLANGKWTRSMSSREETETPTTTTKNCKINKCIMWQPSIMLMVGHISYIKIASLQRKRRARKKIATTTKNRKNIKRLGMQFYCLETL